MFCFFWSNPYLFSVYRGKLQDYVLSKLCYPAGKHAYKVQVLHWELELVICTFMCVRADIVQANGCTAVLPPPPHPNHNAKPEYKALRLRGPTLVAPNRMVWW